MDILVKRTATGIAEVFTLELTELGFSMLTWPQGPPIVFGALLESCFDDTGPVPEEAACLAEGRPSEAPTGQGSLSGKRKSPSPGDADAMSDY